MRGMDTPDAKPAPSLPWYRAILTRSPRGSTIRRRLAVVIVLLGSQIVFPHPVQDAWKRVSDARERLAHPLPIPCQRSRDCTCEGDLVPRCTSEIPHGTCWCAPPAWVAAEREKIDRVARERGQQCEADERDVIVCWPLGQPNPLRTNITGGDGGIP
jgi:hypothetical protein